MVLDHLRRPHSASALVALCPSPPVHTSCSFPLLPHNLFISSAPNFLPLLLNRRVLFSVYVFSIELALLCSQRCLPSVSNKCRRLFWDFLRGSEEHPTRRYSQTYSSAMAKTPPAIRAAQDLPLPLPPSTSHRPWDQPKAIEIQSAPSSMARCATTSVSFAPENHNTQVRPR